jgi:adenine-specific DNA-methyltransferase
MGQTTPEIPIDKIHHGDVSPFLRKLPDECVSLVVSSPPYNLGKEYEERSTLSAYLDTQRDVLRECVRVLRPGGSIYWQVGAYSNKGALIPLDVRFFPILEDLGLTPRNRIMWVRQHGLHGRKKFSPRHETILWFTKGNDHVFNLDAIRVPQKYKNKKHYKGDNKGKLSCNPDGKNPGDIWIFRNVKHNHEEQTIHPCQFPEDMITRIILASTDPGDVVLDPFMGAGTVAVVARDHGRHFMGAEKDARYHDVAIRRLAGLPNADGVFPNLKTLRDYVERTGEPIAKFRFEVQVGRVPTDRSKSKIFPEHHHREELERRLEHEEAAFGAQSRGEEPPEDYFKGGQVKTADTLPLFPAE